MSTTYADVLAALWKVERPISATELASRMGRSRAPIRNILAELASTGRAEREQVTGRREHFVYRAKVQP
jgi:predicted transcriptional regulator